MIDEGVDDDVHEEPLILDVWNSDVEEEKVNIEGKNYDTSMSWHLRLK